MRRRMDRHGAENIAVEALGRIVHDDERLERFLALTGLDPGSIRGAAADPHFLESVLDHVCADEALLVSLAGEMNVRPEAIAQAREILAGPPFID